MKPWILAASFVLIPVGSFAQLSGPTSITLNSTNARPGDSVTIVVNGTSGGCLPRNPVPSVDGRTITIRVTESASGCGACTTATQPYNLQVRMTLPSTPGIYDVNLVAVNECNNTSRLVASQQFAFANSCSLGQSLVASPSSVRVGDDVNLSWCDPSTFSVDAGYFVSSYTIFSSQSQMGPFTKVADVTGETNTHATVKAGSAGTTYYYVVSHGCQGAINLCNNGTLGDTVQVSNVLAVGVGATNTTSCLPGPSTLCLLNGRFEATAQYKVTGQTISSPARAVALTDQSGYFWFFGPDNVEVTLKALNACPSSYWVFASGMTNVGVDINVRDTQTGRTKTYSNALGTAFAPILDTSAFPCP